jgi:hypothetical protein
VLRAAGRVGQRQPLPDEHQRDERLQSLHSHKHNPRRRRRGNPATCALATSHAPAAPPSHMLMSVQPRGAHACGSAFAWAHRRLLPPPKGLPMHSLRSRPSPSRASHRWQPRTAVGLRRLTCGAARSDNASVSTTTLVRRTHGCTGRPRAAARCYVLGAQARPLLPVQAT